MSQIGTSDIMYLGCYKMEHRKENMEKIKRTIAGIRKDLGLTQKEMAEQLGIPLVSYARYEKGVVPTPVEIAVAIADLGGVVDLREIKFY